MTSGTLRLHTLFANAESGLGPLVAAGALRPLLGAISGLVIFVLLKGGLIPLNIPKGESGAYFVIAKLVTDDGLVGYGEAYGATFRAPVTAAAIEDLADQCLIGGDPHHVERFWRRELDPEDVPAVEALLIEAGAPPGFATFLAGDGGAEHDRLRTEAEASGVFGVPTFVFNGELFWGGDRIGLLRERLDEKGVKRR